MNKIQCYFLNIYIFLLSIIWLLWFYLVWVSVEQSVLEKSYISSVQVYKDDINNFIQDPNFSFEQNELWLLKFLERITRENHSNNLGYQYISTALYRKQDHLAILITYKLNNSFGFLHQKNQSFIFQDSKLIFQ